MNEECSICGKPVLNCVIVPQCNIKKNSKDMFDDLMCPECKMSFYIKNRNSEE